MARRKTLPPLRTHGFAWGRRRVELGISMSRLAALTGISKAILSQVESGRMVPTGEEFEKVTAALEAVARDPAAEPRSAAGSPIE